MTRPPADRRHPLSPIRATVRLMLSVGVALLTAAWIQPPHGAWWLRALAGWDAGSLTLATLAWIIISKTDARGTRRRASEDDPGHKVVFLIAVASSMVSLLAAGIVLRSVKGMQPRDAALWTVVALAAIVLSWVLTHTSYTFRYANLYYRDARKNSSSSCVQFPGTADPADIDFAYFAFTVGMCFQTSDVAVMTTEMRREVLVHAVLSFVYNTAIVALALNLVISLLS
jgi:uncharacterized membrane protein